MQQIVQTGLRRRDGRILTEGTTALYERKKIPTLNMSETTIQVNGSHHSVST